MAPPPTLRRAPSLATIAREWSRIGATGFGGPPAHIVLLRALCVERERWITAQQFERAIAATNLLPGPASTQLAIYCAWRLRGARGGLLGGACFIAPGLVLVIALAALFLSGSPPAWISGAGRGAGAAVPAVALQAGLALAAPIYIRSAGSRRARAVAYGVLGALVAALAGLWLVLALLACGALELLLAAREQGAASSGPALTAVAAPQLLATLLLRNARSWAVAALRFAGPEPGGTAAISWTALKVGALSFGGGFVIVPLMQADAVSTYHWMTHGQFLNAVALGQVTPGPVVLTVAAVGFSAAGVGGALLAALIAFAPSFAFVLAGAPRFERLLADARARGFLAGAAPAAAGAIVGSAVPLTAALGATWQYGVLAGAALLLLARRGVVATLLLAGLAGALAALLGASVPA